MVIRDIPPIDKWMEIKPSQTTIIYSSDNKILGRLYKENRIYVPLYKISPYLQQAVVVSEDKEFYTHSGVSIRGLIRAIIVDLLHLRKETRRKYYYSASSRTTFLISRKNYK